MAGVMQGFQDVGDGETREGSVVLDILHPGIQLTDLPEYIRPGPEAQL